MKRESKISASCQGRPKKARAPGPLQRGAEPTQIRFNEPELVKPCPPDVHPFGNLPAGAFGEQETR